MNRSALMLKAICLAAMVCALPVPVLAQKDPGPSRAVTALLVSDIHFDPFHDPGKVKDLARDPVSEWQAVLAAPDSPRAAQSIEQLQAACHMKGEDTPYPLLRSSLDAMRAHAHPRFVTLSGDLIAHQFDCRYQKTMGTAAGYQAFVEKTIQFVVAQMRASWPGVPVYVALGNNDSACGDYQMDPDSAFLRRTAAVFASTLPRAEQPDLLREFPVGGYYSVPLAPLPKTRLIVLNDLYQSPNYRTCSGAKSAAPADAELRWLSQQLDQAQRSAENVWVVGHIPPGVNVYSTIRKLADVCGSEQPVMFLHAGRLDDLLLQHAAEVRLALFGHTHMDEMRLLEGAAGGPGVAVKLVPSISPVDGNNPAFTVARVNPATASIQDYEVFAASSHAGRAWTREYDYAQAYDEPAYTPAALRTLIAGFHSDRKAKTAPAQEYIRNYFVGDMARELTPFWPQYACSLDRLTAKSYAACVCAK